MDIKVTPQQITDNPQFQQFAMFYLINGGPIDRDPITGDVGYHFNDNGERMIDQEKFDYLASIGLEIDQATCFVEMTEEEYETEVPSVFPEATYTEVISSEDSENIETITHPRAWSDYAPFVQPSVNEGKVIVRCVHVPHGSTCGMGLPASEFSIWKEYFGERILCRVEGEKLIQQQEVSI